MPDNSKRNDTSCTGTSAVILQGAIQKGSLFLSANREITTCVLDTDAFDYSSILSST
jgi:hypothetical protein